MSKANTSPQTNINNRNTGYQSANQTSSQNWSLLPSSVQLLQLQKTVGNQAVIQMLRQAVSGDVIQRTSSKRRIEDNPDTPDPKKQKVSDKTSTTEDKTETELNTGKGDLMDVEGIDDDSKKTEEKKYDSDPDTEKTDLMDVEGNSDETKKAEEKQHESKEKNKDEVSGETLSTEGKAKTELQEGTKESGDGKNRENITNDEDYDYWTRAVVRIKEDEKSKEDNKNAGKYDINNLMVYKVSISPERRKTAVEIKTEKKGSKKSIGDHLVAWSLMCEYWNKRLTNKPLPVVLKTLKEWLISDEAVDTYKDDKDNTYGNLTNSEKRAIALGYIEEIETNKLDLNKINEYLEQAISYFVEANQASSFATQRESTGGDAEPKALKNLKTLNKEMGEKKYEGEGEIGKITGKVINNALFWAQKLFDTYKKNLKDENLRNKIVTEWYNAVVTVFPDLKEPIVNNLFEIMKLFNNKNKINDKIKDKKRGENKGKNKKNKVTKTFDDKIEKIINTLAELLKRYNEDLKDKGDEDYKQSLLRNELLQEYMPKGRNQEDVEKDLKNIDINKQAKDKTKVLVAVGPPGDNQELKASNFIVEKVELPEKLRAKTQYGKKQGAHTISWTYKVNSLMRMFEKMDIKNFLNKLAELTKRDEFGLDNEKDKNILGQVRSLYAEIKKEINNLEQEAQKKNIEQGKEKNIEQEKEKKNENKRSLHEWILRINELLEKYIKLNQKLPTTTYYGSETPGNHGEQVSNKKMKNDKHEYEDQDRLTSASRYIDIGFFYLDGNILINYFNEAAKAKKESDLEDRAKECIENLYDKHKKKLIKVFSDFYYHLQYFDEDLYKKFSESDEQEKKKSDKKERNAKEQFIIDVFSAPLKKGKKGKEEYTNFANNMKSMYALSNQTNFYEYLEKLIKVIGDKSSAWSKELLVKELQ